MFATPFGRARTLLAAIAGILRAELPVHAREEKLHRLAPYRSRGKGGQFPRRGMRLGNPPGKYMPHQGPRECARRVRQRENNRI